MKNIFLLIIVFIGFMFSCNSYDNKKQLEAQFEKKIYTKADTVVSFKNPENIINPYEISIIKDTILSLTEFMGNYLLTYWDINNGEEIDSFARIGNGPDEFNPSISAHYYSNGDTIEIFDVQRENYVVYKNNIRKEKVKSYNNIDNRFDHLFRISDNKFVGDGIFENGRIALYDFNTNKIKTFFSYPEIKSFKNLTNQQKSMAFDGIDLFNRENKIIVFTGLYTGTIEIYKIEKDTIIKISEFRTLKEDQIKLKEVSDKESLLYVEFDDDSYGGIGYAYATKKYFYVLFGGKPSSEYDKNEKFGKTILCFDWTGKPVKYISLDRSIDMFCVDKNDSKIYSLDKNILLSFNF